MNCGHIIQWRGNAYLVAEDSDGAGRRNLVGREPRGGQLGRDAKDEDLGDGHDALAREQDGVGVPGRGKHLDPAPEARAERAEHDGQAQALQEEKKVCGDDSSGVSSHKLFFSLGSASPKTVLHQVRRSDFVSLPDEKYCPFCI